jgi:hypothetical protein
MYAIRSGLITLSALAAGLAATAASPSQLAAQDVQYETVTKTALPGALGTAARLAARMGGGSMEVVEQTSIKGRRMRVDSDASSTITDLEGGRVIYLDHDARTYTAFTFEEMLERAQQAGAEIRDANSQRTVSGHDTASTRIDFSISVDDARQRERIGGYDAQRFFLTMQAATEYVPEDGTEREDGGTLVVLTDMWASKDVPVLAARQAFDQTTAHEYAAASATLTEGIAAAFADDPQLRVAFRKSAEEAKKMEGMPVRTVTHFVVVAAGQTFDRDAITNPRPAGGGAAQQAARAGRRQQEDPQQDEQASQAILMTVTSEIRNVRTATLDATLFDVPAGYTEIKPEG